MWALSAIELAVHLAFPGVPQITTAQSHALLDDTPANVVFVDVRTPNEYAVSHLPGALSFPMDNASMQDWSNLLTHLRQAQANAASQSSPNTQPPVTVVAYCSVGYRSAAFIAALQQRQSAADRWQGRNMQGSLFRWAAENRPMVNASGRTTQVHGFARPWAWLVAPTQRVLN